MDRNQLRIRVDGRIDDETATALGAVTEWRRHGDELVLDYIDEAHLAGILVRLADLHISYDHVEIAQGPASSLDADSGRCPATGTDGPTEHSR